MLTSFGDGGRQPNQFYGAHSIATDSKNNIFTTETYRAIALRSSYTKELRRLRKRIRA